MCFKNLPIAFDAHGQARLLDNAWGEPFTPVQTLRGMHNVPVEHRGAILTLIR